MVNCGSFHPRPLSELLPRDGSLSTVLAFTFVPSGKGQQLFWQGTCSLMMSLDLSVQNEVHGLLQWQMEFFFAPCLLFPHPESDAASYLHHVICFILISFVVWYGVVCVCE